MGTYISSPWIWAYDPSAGTYTRKAPLIDGDIAGNGQCPQGCYGTRASGNMAVATLTDATGTHIYMIGGSDSNSTASNRVRVYDPVADTQVYPYYRCVAGYPRPYSRRIRGVQQQTVHLRRL